MWTGNKTEPVPWEYLLFTLCRDVYHCTPTELAEQPLDMIMLHLEFLRVEQQVRDFDKKPSTGRRGG